MPLETGEKAPAFTLPAGPGEEIEVRFGARPVVLLFFPAAFSSVCTSEMGTFRDDWSDWDDLKAEVYAISVDSPIVTSKFKADNDLPFPVLSDFNKNVSEQYGVLYDEWFGLHGVAKRSAFVVDANGDIVYAWVTDDAGVEPDYAAIREAVEQAGP